MFFDPEHKRHEEAQISYIRPVARSHMQLWKQLAVPNPSKNSSGVSTPLPSVSIIANTASNDLAMSHRPNLQTKGLCSEPFADFIKLWSWRKRERAPPGKDAEFVLADLTIVAGILWHVNAKPPQTRSASHSFAAERNLTYNDAKHSQQRLLSHSEVIVGEETLQLNQICRLERV